MAQTVASQKGTLGITWNGSSTGTLFTQSSGTATRVILNTLECAAPSSSTFNVQFFIYNGTTGIYSLLCQIYGNINTPGFAIMAQQTAPALVGVSTTTITNSYIMYNSTGGALSNTLYSTSPSGTQLYASGGTSQYFYFPGNFYMSGGDSLVVRGAWSGTGSVYYNFTTITES